MKGYKLFFALILCLFFLVFYLTGCAAEQAVEETPDAEEPSVEETATEEAGTLIFTANGEEFIREGFVCKDGWELSFDHAFVTLASISAFQTDPPYDTEVGWDIDDLVVNRVNLADAYTVDLADDDADPAVLAEVEGVTAGRYNALYWELVQASSGLAEGYAILLIGTAEKDGDVISFSLGFEKGVAILGGEYIGEERKGILVEGGEADVEMTFHFDHLFGDYDEDPEDELNLEALGFGPLAALGIDGVVEASLADLNESLSNEDYEILVAVMTHLAHVGEGHCLARFLD